MSHNMLSKQFYPDRDRDRGRDQQPETDHHNEVMDKYRKQPPPPPSGVPAKVRV